MSADNVFPLFLKLEGRSVLVVGSAEVVESKVPALLAAGATVTIVSEDEFPSLEAGSVNLENREFQTSDLEGQWYVVAGASLELNEVIAAQCEDRQIFVNVVDDRKNATAYLGSVIRRDGYLIALSSGGQSPAVLKLLREGLERLVPNELSQWTQVASSLREQWSKDKTPHQARVPQLFRTLLEKYVKPELPVL